MYLTAPALSPSRRKLSCDPTGLGRLPVRTRSRRYLRGLGVEISRSPRRVTGPYTVNAIAPWDPIRVTGPYTVAPVTTSGSPATPWPQARRRTPTSSAVNPAGGANSVVLDYDQAGNPVYSVPPPGQSITGYDVYGNPLYGAPANGQVITGYQNGLPVYGYSTQYGAPSAAAAAAPADSSSSTPGTIIGVDASGNPIYNSPPPGAVQTGVDAQGTPIYGSSGDTSGYSSILNWLSGSTLISGLPNWGILAGGFAGYLLLQSKLSGGKRG